MAQSFAPQADGRIGWRGDHRTDANVGALPPNDFPASLRREKRRAERSHRPLSIVLYRVNPSPVESGNDEGVLLELLHETCRATDVIGHVGDEWIAVLCPDTDTQGMQGFIKKIESAAKGSRFTAVAATYPDRLFDLLAGGQMLSPQEHQLVVTEFDRHGNRGYCLKRSLDVVGAILGIVFTAPLMIAVATTVALTSKGPVIFRQTRLGMHGRPFVFYKFRSMAVGTDDSVHRDFVSALINGETRERSADAGTATPVYKLRTDPRVTPVGRIIRMTSLDELPQFFNVLKGDMSLVGPRPPLPYEAANYQAWHLRRILSARPGITGLWQVEGRSRVSFNDMVRMDLRYIRQCSLWLDLKILARTVRVVLRCEGAV
jgi:lipopolysaccharide/colanic/teichoic acid biosynthesis glycosyltransferase